MKRKAIDFIRNNPVFYSRLGFCYDPPLKNEHGAPLVFTEDLSTYGNFHRAFSEIGVKIHSCILHSGWVGVNTYDYSLTDRVLDELFCDEPDGYYIPRIKLNVPIDWCEENPEDVFVYYGGPETKEEIKKLVGTLKQDYIGYESPNGYYMSGDYVDTRPNVGGLIARQSFSSRKWLEDAGIALEKLLDRLENSKYADRILGYHIAYGASGECVLWGRASNRYGDYGIGHKKAFFDWGVEKYGSVENLSAAWQQPDISRDNVKLPSPDERYGKTQCVESFFRGYENQTIATDFDVFISEVNANAIEYFGKVVKEKTAGKKLFGAFYGYFIHVDNSAYTGHLALERLLQSPYVDFFAAPKSYYRTDIGNPGGVLCTTQSINQKKLWLDELDNRTYLATNVEDGWGVKNFEETKTVFWREFSKNLADDSGFWWMDLGGGWFDSPDIMNEFSSLVQANKLVRNTEHKSESDILMLVDEECMCHMNISKDLRLGFMEDFLCELHMTGCLVDVYRLDDVKSLDLSQYKLIIFAYTFNIGSELREYINRIPPEITLMFNYASGIISDNGVDISNISALTGLRTEPCDDRTYNFPSLKIVEDKKVEILIADEAANIRVGASVRANGGKNIVNTKPFLSCVELRDIADKAGCHSYVHVGNTLYGDNRFIAIFPNTSDNIDVTLKEKGNYVNLITHEEFNNTNKILINGGKTMPAFLLKNS